MYIIILSDYRSISRDVTVFSAAILEYLRYCVITYKCMKITRETTRTANISMIPSSNTPNSTDLNGSTQASIPISDYAKKLDPNVKRRYFDKINCIGIDPVLIPEKSFDPDCLPPVESADILSYLVLETSFYTKDQFKNFRSLEAFNQLVSGFVTGVQGHVISDKFVVAAKVRHSQRMNDTLIPVWIITEKAELLSEHIAWVVKQDWPSLALILLASCTILRHGQKFTENSPAHKWLVNGFCLHSLKMLVTRGCETSTSNPQKN